MRPFESLRVPAFRAYIAGMFLVFGSMQMQQVARSWFMYDLTHSPMMLAMLGIASGAPMLLLSLVGGALADRFAKKTILMIALVGMATGSFLVAILVVSGATKGSVLATLLIASVLQATSMAFMLPARQSMVPELVGKRLLLNAIALSSAEMNATRMVLPALAGILIGSVGVGPVFFIMAGMVITSFFIIAVFLPKTSAMTRTRKTTVLGDMGETFGYLGKKPLVRDLLVLAFVSVVFGMPFQLLLPIFTTDYLKVGPEGLGFLMSVMGVGALVGSVVIATMSDFRRKGMLMLAITVVFGLGILAFTMSPSFVIASIVMLPLGMGSTGRMTLNNTLLQMHVDDHMRARVMGLYMMEVGMQPVGSVPMAALAGIIGAPWAVGGAGILVAAYGVYAWVFRPALRRI
jgi:MFS family permease